MVIMVNLPISFYGEATSIIGRLTADDYDDKKILEMEYC